MVKTKIYANILPITPNSINSSNPIGLIIIVTNTPAAISTNKEFLKLAFSILPIFLAKNFKINATPTIIINNEKFEKTLTYKSLKKAIEKLI